MVLESYHEIIDGVEGQLPQREEVIPASTGNFETDGQTLPMGEAPGSDMKDIELEIGVLSVQETQERWIKRLEARVAELKKRNKKAEEKAQAEEEKSKKMERVLICPVCLEPMQNPQILECGHSACYACLWGWWTVSDTEDREPSSPTWTDDSTTDWEEDSVDQNVNPDLHSRPPSPPPPQIPATVTRPKFCPYCKTRIFHRPTASHIIHDMVQILENYLPPSPTPTPIPTPGSLQSEKDVTRQMPKDIWQGVFRPELNTRIVPEPLSAEASTANQLQSTAAVLEIRRDLEERLQSRNRELEDLEASIARLTQQIPRAREQRDDAARNRALGVSRR